MPECLNASISGVERPSTSLSTSSVAAPSFGAAPRRTAGSARVGTGQSQRLIDAEVLLERSRLDMNRVRRAGQIDAALNTAAQLRYVNMACAQSHQLAIVFLLLIKKDPSKLVSDDFYSHF